MAVFNFEIKRQSYEIAIKQTQDALRSGDIEEGSYYLSHAIELGQQLVQNCVVAPVREQYAAEYRKLLSLQSSLQRGVNPFVRPATPVTSYDPPVNTGAAEPASGGFRAGNAGAERPRPTSEPTPKSTGKAAAEPKSKSQFFSEKAPDTRLSDVAGLADVKRQIRLRVIEPMKDPELYRKYMGEAGCQILMYGPPGCGKSYVAEAIAGELGCAYAIINASDLLDKYVGEGPKKVVQIFKDAEAYDNCLIFFDELDSVFSSRESDDSKHTKDILTTFLTCLSGFHSKEANGVRVIVGATNRPWALDSALIRGKRFDTHIYVGLPDQEARAFLVKKAFKKHQTLLENSDLTEEQLTDLFDGYSCADISAMIEKMKTRAFERALDRRDRGEDGNEPVTYADATAVLSSYRNSVSPESLEAFKAFERGEI